MAKLSAELALSPREQKLGKTLVSLRVIDDMQLQSALANADQWGQRLTQSILQMRLASEDALTNAIARISQVPKLNLQERPPDAAALTYLDAATCSRYGVLPIALSDQGKTLHLGMVDPTNLELIDHISAHRRVRVRTYALGEMVLEKAVRKFYHGESSLSLDSTSMEAPVSDMNELKLVDNHGNTMMVSNAVLQLKGAPPSAPAAPPKAAPNPAVRAAPPPAAAPKPPPSAPLPPPASTVASASRVGELERELAQVKQTLTQTENLCRVLTEVLVEKRVITLEEVRQKFSSHKG